MMRALKTEAAAPGVRSRNGGEIGKALAGTSSLQRYRTNRFPSMPSPERSDKIALLVCAR